jgi:TonB-dependent receptor
MIQRRTHEYDYTYFSGADVGAMLRTLSSLGITARSLNAKTFFDPSYSVGGFLGGVWPSPYPINIGLMETLLPSARGGFQKNAISSTLNNYDGFETKQAAYAMATVNIGDDLSILPGVRYQILTTNYTAWRGIEVFRGVQGKDTTVHVPHGLWLPMLHVRYQPWAWLQLRAAYTNTLTYSDYSTLTPRYFITLNEVIDYNNFNIRPATSENIDLVCAVHSNNVGLLSIDGFRKRIRGLVFFSHRFMSDLTEFPDLPQARGPLYELNTYVNNTQDVVLYGVETEWQTNFWYLPGFLSGFVLNLNYTHIFSEAKYPRSLTKWTYEEDGNATRAIIDTFYSARLLDQPNDVFNLMIGYDIQGFSARVSFLYQDNIFRHPDFWPQLRTMSGTYARWDLSVKQELPVWGMQIYVNVNNLTSEDDVTRLAWRDYSTAVDQYGLSASAGLRFRW